MFVPNSLFIADAESCAPTLATFGVGTNIKSIPLTSKHHWGDGSKVDPPPYTKIKVNRIDLIVVPTPKLHQVGGHFLVLAPNRQINSEFEVQTLVLMSIFTCCVGTEIVCTRRINGMYNQ